MLLLRMIVSQDERLKQEAKSPIAKYWHVIENCIRTKILISGAAKVECC